MKNLITKFINNIAAKFLYLPLVVKLKDYIKSAINLVPIPSFLSFFILKNGKIDPTSEEILKEAPAASNNWNRLGLDKKIIGELPRWSIFFLIAIVIFIHNWTDIVKNILTTFSNFMLSTFSFPNGAALPFKYGIDGIIYLVDILAKFGGLLPLSIIFYYIVKSFKK